ncbi:UDP-2,4-diacetamido-2,4,6-trideoxy-beta-L-altropyranose hydrolase [Salinimicrobium sediminilitoris]|uniref:UDP-2,4-diacetamido-2,4, 6-trideoxy-beta-L-altropyranose hydrolase n=1 Tax=Salinimicrobium sediminilitoris TaxID=2876715 RepID=UPI001E3A9418|nr:UDP-2,4-diacetamido-2,4,6-trideoxy-beta-L-altropyranose hydrolase [Salinimicrobium sediminilitoris]MCC8358747.1 UDP-2,4-diacetamido-2,4,6-trideoxy-beta-L-altropyranose hydrolase [Salinimicrobium sediminilitoris]
MDQIFIRVDGNVEWGIGHLIRSLGLAHMLKKEFYVHFFCLHVPQSIAEEIRKDFIFHKISTEEEFLSEITGAEIVVLDHYRLGSSYQKKIKNLGAKLVCIDDKHDQEFFADLIINHSPAVQVNHYKAQDYTSFALGPEYALLRPSFFKNFHEIEKKFSKKNIFICFGGADYKNISKQILEQVSSFDYFEQITVVVGPAYLHQKSLKSLVDEDERINLLDSINEEEMLLAMATSGLAIVPASNVLYEVAVTGAQPIIYFNANVQHELHEYLLNNSRAPCLDVHDFDPHALKVAIIKSLNLNNKEPFFLREKILNSPGNNLKKIRQLVNSSASKIRIR